MSSSILVAYATRYGSTQEVAETIAAVLREQELAVDLQPMSDVRALDAYHAVVLGAPISMGRWHKGALRFLSQYQEALAQRPVAIFALGPLHDDAKEFQEVRALLDQERAAFPWLQPIACELFGGRYDPSKLRLMDRLMSSLPASPMHGMPASDARNWPEIHAWARALAAKLAPALHETEAQQ